jgi:hypothetical protein
MNKAGHGDANQYRARAVALAIRNVADRAGSGGHAAADAAPGCPAAAVGFLLLYPLVWDGLFGLVLAHGQRLTGAPQSCVG